MRGFQTLKFYVKIRWTENGQFFGSHQGSKYVLSNHMCPNKLKRPNTNEINSNMD